MKCKKQGCKNKVKKGFIYCYAHRDLTYQGTCSIHGKTTFKNNSCVRCKIDKIPLYTVSKIDGKYITKTGFVLQSNIDYLERLVNHSRQYQEQFIKNITTKPGIYGIFIRDRRHKKQLGKCLYIGQSINIKNRIAQHRDCLKIASFHLRGLRIHKKRVVLNSIKRKVDLKYYKIANKHTLGRLKFVALFVLDDTTLITYCEQAMMDAYKPIYNTFAARPSIRKENTNEKSSILSHIGMFISDSILFGIRNTKRKK